VVIGVRPAVERPFDREVDLGQPPVVATGPGARWQDQQLPLDAGPDRGDRRHPTRATGVGAGARPPRVGGHQPLLQPEDEVLRGSDGGRDRRLGAPGPQLKRVERLAHVLRQVTAAAQAQELDLPEHVIGCVQELEPVAFGGFGIDVSEGDHGWAHLMTAATAV
jgi:hypothetical protein